MWALLGRVLVRGSCDSTADHRRLRQWMKAKCVTVGCMQLWAQWGLSTQQRACACTQALLPLPWGHHFLDNERISASEAVSSDKTKPQALPVVLWKGQGFCYRIQIYPWFSFLFQSDPTCKRCWARSHFRSRRVVQWNQATSLGTALHICICIHHASGKPACECFSPGLVPPSCFFSECLTPKFAKGISPSIRTELKALFSARSFRGQYLLKQFAWVPQHLKCPVEG